MCIELVNISSIHQFLLTGVAVRTQNISSHTTQGTCYCQLPIATGWAVTLVMEVLFCL